MKVLFGLFDWGLGHATRSSIIIDRLLKDGNSVDIISTGRALKLIKDKYQDKCKYFDVPSLYPPYTKTRFFELSFALSIPKMYKSLIDARKISKKIIENGRYDLVLSDCRYDVYDNKENSYLINHQLRFCAPLGISNILEYWLQSKSKNYNNVIVPDFEKNSLSGILSHDLNYYDKNKVKYVGPLSHLKEKDTKKDIDYFISITGPEPQRTILENNILNQVKDLEGKIVITGGNPDKNINQENENITYLSFANSKIQEDYMNRCKLFISRTGYTTMSELYEIGIKKAILTPTPGQTEQEYLAKYYRENKMFYTTSQYRLNIKKDIENILEYKGFKKQHKTEKSIENISKIIYN